jgi:hypothetical protein
VYPHAATGAHARDQDLLSTGRRHTFNPVFAASASEFERKSLV